MGNRHSKLISIIIVLVFLCQQTALAGLDFLRPSAHADRKKLPENGVIGILDRPEYYPELVLNLRTGEEFATLRRNGMLLRDLYRQFSPDSKRDLLNPNMILMVLGALHGYVRDSRMDPQRFCNEIAAAKLEAPLNFVITDRYIIEANYFLTRLREEGKLLVDMGSIKQAEIDFLLSGPMDAAKAQLIGRIAERTLSTPIKRIAILAFIMGYPIQYLQMLADAPDNPTLLFVSLTRYGIQIPVPPASAGIVNSMVQVWDAVLDYGYALLATERDFDKVISKRTKAAFDYRVNSAAPFARFLLDLRAQSAAAQNTARAI